MVVENGQLKIVTGLTNVGFALDGLSARFNGDLVITLLPSGIGADGLEDSDTVQASFDDGKTWQAVRLDRNGDGGTVHLRHPKGHGYVSLKATAANSTGNTVDETIIRAYRY